MAGRLAALVRLARPGNLALGALGVLAGGLAVYGAELAAGPLALTAIVAMLGMAGGNALNDAADAVIDLRAHPDRPIPQGVLSVPTAAVVGFAWLALAVTLGVLVNAIVAVLAALLALMLLLYELYFKGRGVLGNVWVSWVVAGTFLMGAAGGRGPLLAYGAEELGAILAAPALPVAFAMAFLAFLTNTAREIYKDIQDADFDAGRRRTLPMTLGPEAARRTATMFLLVAIPLAFVPVLLEVIDARFAFLVAPALAVFLAAAFTRVATTASWRVKIGMALALPAFVVVGLL